VNLRLLLFAAAVPLIAQGCATVFVRGVVRDAAGEPVGNASLQITSAQTGKLLAAGVTDGGGCFHLLVRAPEGEKSFALDASAPGYKPATYTMDLESHIVLTNLAAISSGQPSRIRRLSYEESYGVWELICQPPSPIGN
jgi:hypothetical protein